MKLNLEVEMRVGGEESGPTLLFTLKDGIRDSLVEDRVFGIELVKDDAEVASLTRGLAKWLADKALEALQSRRDKLFEKLKGVKE